MRKLLLITRFYKGIFLANFLVTLSCLYLVWKFRANAPEIIGVLFWYKVITINVVLYATIQYRKNELYYYQNLGVSKLLLWITISAFDFLLWLMLIILMIKTR